MSSVTHTFVNPQADGIDQTVQRPSDWNAQHAIPAGTEALPSLGPSSDASVGWWFPAAETAALSTNGVERSRVDANGLFSANLNAGTIYDSLTWSQTLNSRFNANTIYGGNGAAGSANEFGVMVQFLVPGDTSAAAGYEKAALYVLATTADPSASAVLNRDIVGVDMRGYVAVPPGALGRAWGSVSTALIPAGGYDGQIIAHEIDVYNSGTDQTLILTTTSKYGIHIGSLGAVAATAAINVMLAASTFHYGFVMDAAALAVNGDKFLQLSSTADGSTDIFHVDKLGNIVPKAGTTGMTSGFVYVSSAAGAPSGTPTTKTDRCAMYFDRTNNRLYVYDAGWISVVLA